MKNAWPAVLIVALTATLSARQSEVDVPALLERAGVRVAEYFARAQSIMCLERVALQPLTAGMSAEGPARVVESELRLSWQPTAENPIPTEAKTLRQVLRVNGGKPLKKDHKNCTEPEQNDVEEQPLSFLLPSKRDKNSFKFDRREQVDGRDAIVLAFREVRKPAVDVWIPENNEDCISFDIDGGRQGRVWIDAQTHDVLRVDRSLSGMIEVPLPRKIARRPGAEPSLTLERLDASIRFKRVAFQDPEETLVLPVTFSELKIIRGPGGRQRTNTQYQSYRRFITAGRIIPPK